MDHADRLNNHSPAILLERAELQITLENYEQAANDLRIAINSANHAGRANLLLGFSLCKLGDYQEAEEFLNSARDLTPDLPAPHYQLGELYRQRGDMGEAIESFRQAAEISPGFGEVETQLGICFETIGLLPNAAESYRRSLELTPMSLVSANNLGKLLTDNREYEEAVELLSKAIRNGSDHFALHNQLAIASVEIGEFETAETHYARALELNPSASNVLFNLGNLLLLLKRLDEAEDAYQASIRSEPSNKFAQLHLTHLQLLRGDFEQGWKGYEVRKQAQPKHYYSERSAINWDGNAIPGKTLQIRAEQGFGDTIQFVRFIDLVKQRSQAQIQVACQPKLIELLQYSFDADIEFVSADADSDFFVSMMSLPQHFLQEHLPSRPYLEPNTIASERWRNRIEGLPGLRVGIAWQGSPTYPHDHMRSIPLAEYAPLNLKRVSLVSLQKFHGHEEIEDNQHLKIHDFGKDLDEQTGAFVETAAVISMLDLVITSDTAIAHLAGALGTRVWLATAYLPEWRWMLDRTDTPWYPSMKLYRQPAWGDWASVFQAMAKDLCQFPMITPDGARTQTTATQPEPRLQESLVDGT